MPGGTYAGYRFDTYGNITASESTTLSAGSTIWATEKSTIPNRAGNWYYVTVGALESYWVLEVAGMSLGAAPRPLPVPIAVYNPPRELLISGLRLAAIERGVVIAARDLGKLKTWAQATAAALGGFAAAGAWDDAVGWWALLIALILTWVSGLDYARSAPRLLRGPAV